MKKKVLFVDNDPDFLETRVERLQEEGFQVYQAGSPEEAERVLKDRWLHVAIIDIRLRDDTDDQDKSGLTLAKKERYQPISKIILTRYPTYQYAREALAPALSGQAIAFIAKQEGIQPMLRAVEEAFEKYVGINWKLLIQWGALHSFDHLLTLLGSPGKSALRADRANELEELFRKLFVKSTQITINRSLYDAPGRVMLELFAYGDAGEQQFVVSCGQREMIRKELEQYEQFAPQGAGVGSTIKEKMAETTHFAAIAYRLIGGDLQKMLSFKAFYASHAAEQVGTALQHLFDVTLARWHNKKRSYGNHQKSLNDAYRAWLGVSDDMLDKNVFEQQVQAICRKTLRAGLPPLDYSAQMLTFHLADGQTVSYANPVRLLSAQAFAHQPIIYGLTHGQVNANTVLVDQQGQSWQLDFSNAGVGPLLRDWVSLEIAIKFELLDALGLYDRHKMEMQLLGDANFNNKYMLQSTSMELKKAIILIETLRDRAARLPNYDHASYLEGLFFCAVKHLLSYNPNLHYPQRHLLPYAHTLLSLAMLSDKLIGERPKVRPAQSYRHLRIDQENKVVWVEGRQISVTPQEFNILLYLYEQEGQVCSRQKIVENALNQEFDKINDAGLLNNAISRLRQKIEPDPKKRKYLITKRGFGYQLLSA